MSKQQKNTPAEDTSDSKAPTHALFHIAERGQGKKNFWTEIGVGWLNQDGSVNIRSEVGALILPGQSYQLRLKTEKDKAN